MSLSLQQVLLAFCTTLAFIWWLARIAPRFGLVDAPDQRKIHTGHIPLVGGLAIFLTLVISALVWQEQSHDLMSTQGRTLWVFLLAGGVLVVLGIFDDRSHVSVFTRTVVEIGVALIVIEGLNMRANHLGDLFGTGHIALSDWMAYPFTVVAIFGVINAFNMLDGMDGLLALIVLITIMAFHMFTGMAPGVITLTVGASLVAFLVSNLKLSPFIPKTFLGDAGSKLLGFIVVALILAVTSAKVGGQKYIQPVTALYLVALPLFDMVFTTCRRLVNRSSPFRSDRGHIHHLMQDLGMSNRRALLVIGCIGVTPPFLGFVLSQSGAAAHYQFYIFLGAFALYCVLMSQAWQVAARIKHNQPGLQVVSATFSEPEPPMEKRHSSQE